MALSVRKVDATKPRIKALLRQLHEDTFGDSADVPEFYGYWWIVYDDTAPVGFAGLVQSTLAPNVGYLKRSGVLPSHRGQGLQMRLLKAREAYARRLGWASVISDTAFHNIHSSNNLIKAGYSMFEPPKRWAFAHGLYWIKEIE